MKPIEVVMTDYQLIDRLRIEREEEREACAKVCDERVRLFDLLADVAREGRDHVHAFNMANIASALTTAAMVIRARGTK